MNKTITVVITVLAATLMLALSPLLLASNASAEITPTTTCTKHGVTSDGPCHGNSPTNGKTELTCNLNPQLKAPKGQNTPPC